MTLACQWACAPRPAEQARHHEAHHHGALGLQATTDDTGSLLPSTEQRCDHTTADFMAIAQTLAQLGAPDATAASTLFGQLLPLSMEAGAVITTPSPPGRPPRPFSLRI